LQATVYEVIEALICQISLLNFRLKYPAVMARQYSNESCHELPLAGSVQPNLLLESFLPGFSIISDLLARWGIDVSSYVTVFLVLTAAAAWIIYSASTFSDMLKSHFTSTVTIRMDDEA
jgi:hypothetical protein